MKLLRAKVNEVAKELGKTLLIFGSENAVRILFFLKHCYNHRSMWIEAVRFETEQDCSPFAQRRHHVLV